MTDHASWIEALVEQYERPLCRYAYSLSGSASVAQDAVQETFLRLCRAERSRIEGHEAPWLFRVCRSRVIDMKRKDRPVQPLTPLETERLTAAEPSPADAAAMKDAQSLVPRLMRRLPERQAEAVRLKFQESLSYREIAHVMHTTESNVGFLIHMGIKSLRAHMHALQGA